MEKIIRFFKTAGVYFIGNVLTKLISFFLLPLYTRKINPVSFGNYGLVVSIVNVLVPIVFFSIWDAVFRFSFDHPGEDGKYQVLNNGFIVMLTGSIVFVLGTGIFHSISMFSNPVLICCYSLAMGYQYYYTVISRALQDNNLFVFSGLANSIVAILLNIILILELGMGVESLYISYIVGVIIQIIIIEWKKRFLKHISLKRLQKSVILIYLKFSIPITISSISNWLLNGLTQVYITYSLGSYYNGLYNVANKFSSVMILGIGMFQFAWYELAYDLANNENKTQYYKKSISEILRLSIIGVSVLIVLVKIVYPVMVDAQYNESLIIIPILLIGTMAHTYAGFIGTLFLADRKTISLLLTTILAGLVNLTGLLVLTKIFGFIGSVSSLCIAFIISAVARLALLKKEMGILPYGYSFLPVIILMISVVSFYFVESRFTLCVIMIVLCLLSVFMVRDLVILGIKMIHKRKKRVVSEDEERR